mgnify:CR=1 FL=1
MIDAIAISSPIFRQVSPNAAVQRAGTDCAAKLLASAALIPSPSANVSSDAAGVSGIPYVMDLDHQLAGRAAGDGPVGPIAADGAGGVGAVAPAGGIVVGVAVVDRGRRQEHLARAGERLRILHRALDYLRQDGFDR